MFYEYLSYLDTTLSKNVIYIGIGMYRLLGPLISSIWVDYGHFLPLLNEAEFSVELNWAQKPPVKRL